MPPNTSTDAGADNCTQNGNFVHIPFPPYIPPEAKYADQRYFSRNGEPHRKLQIEISLDAFGVSHSAEADVYRNACKDTAELRLTNHTTHCRFESMVSLGPAELRELASRLLDAAHDLEINPAKKLVAELQKGGQP
ncbi:hypothetical protein [Limnohabitans sp.]|uniref:hypothetical protein n=1 Tax=Limnohabitans sp. TaxID=1907725 RepID=UPI00286F1746|nr:hypothetical protein [Limnohabitans sp.]